MSREEAEAITAAEERHDDARLAELAEQRQARATDERAAERQAAADETATRRRSGDGGFSTADNPPSPRRGASAEERAQGPAVSPVTVTLHLAPRTIALFDASRTNDALGFEGSMSEWVDAITDAFFESIGMSIKLVQMRPVYDPAALAGRAS